MSREFVTAPLSMKSETPIETPYLKARQEWDSRIGTSVAQAKNWRIACLLCGTALLMSVFGLVTVSSQQRLIPVVVTVDEKSGETNVVGPITNQNYAPRDSEIRYFLSRWIQNVRSVPSDPAVVKKNWNEAYKFMRRPAANKLNELVNSDEDSHLHQIGRKTVSVAPIAIVRVGENNSFQARWSERVYDAYGTVSENYTMTAIFSIEIAPPRREDILLENPLGIFITSFQWSRDLK